MNEHDTSGRRYLSTAALIGLCLLTLLRCAEKRSEPLGGKWFIQWETSQLARSGRHHPSLHRGTALLNRRVEENTWRYRYLGDDCVLYVPGNSDRGELLAACGDNRPVMIAPQMDDYTNGDIADGGLRGDPVV